MVVQIRIQVSGVELLDQFGVLRRNVSPSQVLAHDGAVFALCQSVIVGMAGTAFRLLNHQLV